jgi:uncharacterized RmlC-like cupin family protein
MDDAPDARHVTVLRPAPEVGKQDVPTFFGVSRTTAGARTLSLNLTAFPPGGQTVAHAHRGFESALYGVRGAVELFYGPRLEHSVVIEAGTFCFIPPDVPHKAYNLSQTEPAEFVTARNDPEEQESVVVTPEADDGSADVRVADTRRRYATGAP